jgi:hypothetical protein
MAWGSRVRRVGASTVFAAGFAIFGAAQAAGDDPVGRRADATQDALGNPTVVAMSELERPGQTGRRATGVVNCTWFEPTESTQFDVTKALPGPPVPPGSALVDDHLYYRHCENGDGDVVFQGWTRWTAATLQVLAADLAYEASRELPLPYPHPVLSPPIGTDQLVGLPTWLWLEPGSWATLDATASVPGLSATATATPTRVRWDMGDGTVVTCDGPGVAYDPARDDDAQSTDCQHVYQHVSAAEPSGSYVATVSIDWAITWSATNGQGGTLPGTSRGTSFPVPVAERQAVVCYGGPDDC